MIKIGCHLSSSAGFEAMAVAAVSLGAQTFQYFTRNPRGSSAAAINPEDVQKCLNILEKHHFAPIIAHAPYTLNLCSHAAHTREYSKGVFADDLLRTEVISGSYYNFHPGSHTGQGTDVGVEQIALVLNETLLPTQTTTVLLETMTGKGSEIGGKFEELKKIIDKTQLKDKLGVCLDTCHVFDAGYNIAENLENVLEEFDKIIGISKLKAVHLNDSKNCCSSKKDRHEKIGEGYIGTDAFERIINHRVLKNLPFILETPQESLEGYAKEIQLLKNLSL